MQKEHSKTIRVSIFYAREDKRLLKKFEEHLKSIGSNKISIWHEGIIAAGMNKAKQIEENLERADLILLLISPSFLASNDCTDVMFRAMHRITSNRENVVVIPIVLRPSNYKNGPIRDLTMLPTNGRPITSWPNADEAFLNVVHGIQEIIDKFLAKGEAHNVVSLNQNVATELFSNGEALSSNSIEIVPPIGPKPTINLLSDLPPSISVIVEQLPGDPHSRPRFRTTIQVAFISLLIFVTIGISLLAYFNSQPTIVTITPSSRHLNANYTIMAVTGKPDITQNQVQARDLSYSTLPQSMTVAVTGVVQKQGVQATGTLTFYNGMTIPQTVLAGTFWYISSGVKIVTDEVANIPAANPPIEGQVTVKAHADNYGISGDIGALSINGDCCTSPLDHTIFAKNLSPFTGGKDPISYTFVQKGDIDDAASSLEQTLTPIALTQLKSEAHANEEFVTSPQCTNAVSSDHNVDDRASTVKVTVIVTCTGEVYDKLAPEKIATALLNQEAATNLGSGYALIHTISTSIVQASAVNANEGTISLNVKASGLWVYQFDTLQKQNLVKLIANKTSQDAIKALKQQKGVSNVHIDGALPRDTKNISIRIASQ
jgi:TIR domain